MTEDSHALEGAWQAAEADFDDAPCGTAITACPQAAGGAGEAAKKKPSCPECAGVGMASDKGAKETVDAFKQLQKDWAKLTPDERRTRLKSIANQQLKSTGAPEAGVRGEKTGSPGSAHLAFKTWELTLDEDTVQSPALSDSAAKSLSNALYHETRHAELWYLMAQRCAMLGQDAATIAKEMSIPAETAAAAVKKPLTRDSQQAKCAQALHDSVYGKNAASRNQTLKELKTRREALEAAQKNHQTITNDPKATAEQKAAALKQWQDAYAERTTNYDEYRALPGGRCMGRGRTSGQSMVTAAKIFGERCWSAYFWVLRACSAAHKPAKDRTRRG